MYSFVLVYYNISINLLLIYIWKVSTGTWLHNWYKTGLFSIFLAKIRMLLVIIICMCPALKLLRNEYHFKNKQIKGTEIVADCILSLKWTICGTFMYIIPIMNMRYTCTSTNHSNLSKIYINLNLFLYTTVSFYDFKLCWNIVLYNIHRKF